MSEPKIADKLPAVMELEPGDYYYCACGESQGQPFCDGAHQRTDFSPVLFQIEEKKKTAICQCKRTATAPFCDGTHAKLSD